jgi:hypothetical protein
MAVWLVLFLSAVQTIRAIETPGGDDDRQYSLSLSLLLSSYSLLPPSLLSSLLPTYLPTSLPLSRPPSLPPSLPLSLIFTQ